MRITRYIYTLNILRLLECFRRILLPFQKHRGMPLLFHDKCSGFFYVHYTTHGTYNFTSHPKDEAIMVKCLAQGHKRRGQDSNPHSDNTRTSPMHWTAQPRHSTVFTCIHELAAAPYQTSVALMSAMLISSHTRSHHWTPDVTVASVTTPEQHRITLTSVQKWTQDFFDNFPKVNDPTILLMRNGNVFCLDN